MRKLLFLTISIFSLIIFGCATTPEVISTEQHAWATGGVNKEQPISIGEVIYSSAKGYSDDNSYAAISYRFMGLDDKNNIRVIYKSEFKPDRRTLKKEETFDLLLPLNPKKQTILKVTSYEDPNKVFTKKELLITVVDEFNRITVEEIGKTEMK